MIDHEVVFAFSIDNDKNNKELLVMKKLDFLLLNIIVANLLLINSLLVFHFSMVQSAFTLNMFKNYCQHL